MALPKTQFYGACSLDGFLSTTDDRLDWLLQFGEVTSGYAEFIANVGALAMGAATYEWLLKNHVHPASGAGQPWPYSQPTWVFTHRRLEPVAGAEIHFAQGSVAPVHALMRERSAEKNIWIVGGGELLASFLDAGLLDELIIQIAPVTLGSGKPLLPRRLVEPAFDLTAVRQYGTTFAELVYAVRKRGA